MEKAIYKHFSLILLLAHLVYSHMVGLDTPKALVAIFLVTLCAFNRYLEKIEIPDMRKEFESYKKQIEKNMAEKNSETATKIQALEGSLSKYDAFIINNPAASTKSLRF